MMSDEDDFVDLPDPRDLQEGCRVAIFGLSANPPTGDNGHRGVVRFLTTLFDEVWVLPVYQHMFSAKRNLLPYKHRMQMCIDAFEGLNSGEKRVRVLSLERHLILKTRDEQGNVKRVGTADVLKHIKSEFPRIEIHLVLGMDSFLDVVDGKWKESENIITSTHIEVMERSGSAETRDRGGIQKYRHLLNQSIRIHHADSLGEVSSTRVRELLKEYWSRPFLLQFWPYHRDEVELRRLLHPRVISYLKKNRLFASNTHVNGESKGSWMTGEYRSYLYSAAIGSLICLGITVACKKLRSR